jgi:fumarylacetoacetase
MLAGTQTQFPRQAAQEKMTEATPDERWTWKSWVESANDPAIGFPLQSLPYCAFSVSSGTVHLGVGIGGFVLDLHELAKAGHVTSLTAETRSACRAAQLNYLMGCGEAAWAALRDTLINLLRDDAGSAQRRVLEPLLVPVESVAFHKPVAIGDYTDFYASIHHATNVGKLFRPDQALLPNYKWLPIGYHGRASSVVISDTAVRRPRGQTKSPAEPAPAFVPTSQLDYELEVAAYIGEGNPLDEPISIEMAEQHIFGLSLLNDWSARDIQSWEYQPLGPFLGKSFATSVSPWVVPMEALLPFRVAPEARSAGDPEPLPYLRQDASTPGAIDLTLEVLLSTARMRAASIAPVRLSVGSLRNLYWTFAQMIAHHTSNGCNLVAGDLLASGTVSGPEPGSQGCLLEITQRGASPLRLPNGEVRTFLEDSDEIILGGYCEKPGFPRISFGECRGVILPSG